MKKFYAVYKNLDGSIGKTVRRNSLIEALSDLPKKVECYQIKTNYAELQEKQSIILKEKI